MEKKRWTGVEIRFLSDNYQFLSTSEIAHFLGRSEPAIRHKARRIGIATVSGSEEHRKRMSESFRGKRHSSESRKKMSEAHRGKEHTLEARRKISLAKQGPKNPNWVEAPEYAGQHYRARIDFPELPLACEFCGEAAATDRMRIDMTLLPYHRDLVAFGCKRCNGLHGYSLSITFTNPHDGLMYSVVRGATLIPQEEG